MSFSQIYQFGDFQLHPDERLLLRDGIPVPLTPKAFETLLALVEKHGHAVRKDELMKRIWPDAFVEEVNLAQNVSAVRRALGADGEQYIETVPKLGYRFVGNVQVLQVPGGTPASPSKESTDDSPARVGSSPLTTKFTLIAITVLVLAVVALLLRSYYRSPQPAHTASAKIESIAVLPLENLSGDPDQEYFADGLTDSLITDIAKIHALRVISRTSVVGYKRKRQPAPTIAQELNVDAIVEGTVMRSGDRVRITAQLIEGRTDRHLWAETYERDMRDILSLQDDVAKDIAQQIRVTLSPPEQTRLSTSRKVDPAAHEAYLRGLYELHAIAAESDESVQLQSIQKAIGYFQLATSRDPNDALAYAGLADAYSSLSTFYRAPLEVMPKAKEAAFKALALDDSLAEAHASLGYVSLTFDWDWARAEHEFQRAVELNPSSPRAHSGYAQYLMFIANKPDDALREMQQAYALDPLLPQSHGDMAWFLFLARRYQEAIDAARRVGHDDNVLALAYAELGQSEEAVASADRALQSPRSPAIRSQVAAAYALAGRKDKARSMTAGIIAQARERYVCGFNVACLYAVLDDKKTAISWLARAYRDRSD